MYDYFTDFALARLCVHLKFVYFNSVYRQCFNSLVCAVCFPSAINRVQLLGRVGRDPEQRGPIVYFPLATTHVVRSSAEEESACKSIYEICCVGNACTVNALLLCFLLP